MSEYNNTILTNAGIDLARRANKGVATFQLTRGVSSTENLSGKTIEELQNITQLPSVQQSVILSDVVNTTDNPDTVLGIRMTFDNQNLKTGYNVHTVGIYAKEPGKSEILYGVATAKTPEYIPDFGEQTLFKFDFLMYLVIGRTDKVTVEVSPDDVYRKKDTYNKAEIDAKVSDAVSQLNNKDAEILKNLNDYKQENKTYHQNLEQQLDTKADKSAVNQQLDTKADKSTTYTKGEVDNRILPKADKNYVDGELSKKADKATTYTKDEVNSKIAGQVKSVNGHIADSNGEVTLPKLKAKTLIAYDVPNKRPTFDENVGFDGSGLFLRWPVDQGVIVQLADAINAKLPIEAGAADDDLCHLTSSKISFWNGNGANVKNLPPMSNKQWFFAIRLVGPGGWGSTTVVDQDGRYWLNTRNDVWTGWRSVTTNETLKKLKFVKQSLNKNGDTFQDTQFVTQESDGTFKINIFDSDWTASKVSWLLKNTKSYYVADNTDLNDIKAPGLYYCSGSPNISNIPPNESNWFSMVVNGESRHGSQTYYPSNSNQLYVRTWNTNGFKQWHRVINDDDYNNLSSSKADKANTYTRNEIESRLSGKADKSNTYTKSDVDSKLSGKANTSDVNARLPLSGGSMNKGSYVMWNTESPYNAHDGDIGGLYWNAASDSIKIFGDNNGSDNLDLAIQLGDDNSNHISFRDKDGVEHAAISAYGHFTGSTDWAGVAGTGINNPTLFKLLTSSNTWYDIIGQDNGRAALAAFRDQSNGSGNTIGNFSSGIVFGGGDTKGALNVAYDKPQARIIGGNGTKPVWSKDVAWKDDLKVTVVRNYDVANNHETQHGVENLNAQWLVDKSALSPFAKAINALNTNLSTLRTELMNLKRRVDYNSPQGEFNDTTVNIDSFRNTGIYRLANCYIQNGPYPTNNAHWVYVKVTVFDANTVYQTLYEGDNMYGRKSYSPTNWGKWHKYLNQEV